MDGWGFDLQWTRKYKHYLWSRNLFKRERFISSTESELTSDTVTGTSWFGIFALEYELPINLDFIGLKFTEILFGYRNNQLEYSTFQNSSSILRNKLKIKSIQYQFGVGFVF